MKANSPESAKFANKADLLKVTELTEETVLLDGIPPVRIRGLMAQQFGRIQDAAMVTKNGKPRMDNNRFRLDLVLHCVVGGDDRRLFGDNERDVVKNMPAAVFNELAAAAQRVNGLVDKEPDDDPSEAQEGNEDDFSST